VSPAKYTAARAPAAGARSTHPAQSVASRPVTPRPEKCCAGTHVAASGPVEPPSRRAGREDASHQSRSSTTSRAPNARSVRADAERRQPSARPGSARRARGPWGVEVVVVVVREHHEVDRRQRVERDARGRVAPRAGERHRRGALAPHRVGEHVPAAELQQEGGVAHPRRGEHARRGARPGRTRGRRAGTRPRGRGPAGAGALGARRRASGGGRRPAGLRGAEWPRVAEAAAGAVVGGRHLGGGGTTDGAGRGRTGEARAVGPRCGRGRASGRTWWGVNVSGRWCGAGRYGRTCPRPLPPSAFPSPDHVRPTTSAPPGSAPVRPRPPERR
jgi:hypothetical protein